MIIYIYGLRDPRDKRMRYVGQATCPEKRLRQHICQSKGNRNDPKNVWLRSLRADALEVELVILQETQDEREGTRLECEWIKKVRDDGGQPFNVIARSHVGREKRQRRSAQRTARHSELRHGIHPESAIAIERYLGVKLSKDGMRWDNLRSVLMRLNAEHETKCARLQELCQ